MQNDYNKPAHAIVIFILSCNYCYFYFLQLYAYLDGALESKFVFLILNISYFISSS